METDGPQNIAVALGGHGIHGVLRAQRYDVTKASADVGRSVK
eukprot:CAMPEP_0167788080 /NCGR_PEP_ID=MMETSP0111_2-20121227/9818_1 /TAXON_ID=91324 /ORGANISM="Lotharella globosa, Strain CCCM811" /LENGTH=41 /DNA_ID= /DNA_START= /DNA_END= /DNA_ORIENTATION=